MSRMTEDRIVSVRAAMAGLLLVAGICFATGDSHTDGDASAAAEVGETTSIAESIAESMAAAVVKAWAALGEASDATALAEASDPTALVEASDAAALLEASEADMVVAANDDDDTADEASILDLDLMAVEDDELEVDAFEQTFRYLKAKYGTETLTDDWFGLGGELEERGIVISLAFTQVYQINLQGGLATHRHSGRWTGKYDLHAAIDLEKLAHIKDGLIYVLAKGGWSNGLDPSSIGSAVGNVNTNASTIGNGDEVIYVSELWYQQGLFNNRARFRIGKMDLTSGHEFHNSAVAFDQNAYAFDETSQFMNAAFVNNPTIPFPSNGLGVSALVEPVERFYIAAAVVDQQADARETGFNTAFHDEDYFFAIFETGITPAFQSATGRLPGAYRVGFWYDPHDKAELNGDSTKRDDVGFYLSFDQVLIKENVYLKDEQGLGLFTRYGFAHSDVNLIKCFWSVGAQYKGLIPKRDGDVFAFAFGQGTVDSDAGFNKDHETIMEVYYNAQLTPWFNLSPSLQYIWDPGAVHGVGNAVVVGVRMQMFF